MVACCPTCHRPLPLSEQPDPRTTEADVVVGAVAAVGGAATVRDVAVHLSGALRPSGAAIESARRVLESLSLRGRLVRVDGGAPVRGAGRPATLYRLPSVSTGVTAASRRRHGA